MTYAIIIVVAVIVGGCFVVVSRTASMNKDAVQQELAALMMAVLAEAKAEDDGSRKMRRDDNGSWKLDRPLKRDFIEAWNDVRVFLASRYPSLSIGQRQTKLAHALSLIRPMLDEWDYDLLRRFCRSYNGDR